MMMMKKLIIKINYYFQGRKGDVGAWKSSDIPQFVVKEWDKLKKEYEYICSRQPMAKAQNNINHLGTLGTGNHFIEVKLCEYRMWFYFYL